MGFVERQLDAQRCVYGIDPPSLRGQARARFLWDMVAAAKEELTEIRRCFDAKVYTGLQYSGGLIKTRDEFVSELADLLCFIGNIAALESVSTTDLNAAHALKVEQNRVRHARSD